MTQTKNLCVQRKECEGYILAGETPERLGGRFCTFHERSPDNVHTILAPETDGLKQILRRDFPTGDRDQHHHIRLHPTETTPETGRQPPPRGPGGHIPHIQPRKPGGIRDTRKNKIPFIRLSVFKRRILFDIISQKFKKGQRLTSPAGKTDFRGTDPESR